MKQTKAGHYFYDEYVPIPDLYVSEHVGTNTGVLDVDGKEIVRPPRKIGFI